MAEVPLVGTIAGRKRAINCALQRAQRGYSTVDTFSFDDYLAGVIAGGVGELLDRGLGHPAELSEEGWRNILTQIRDGFADYDAALTDADAMEAFETALDLLSIYFMHLWD